MIAVLFSIELATSLCNGFDPSSLHYSQDLLREHLLNCIEEKYITSLPPVKIRSESYVKKKFQSSVFVARRSVFVARRSVFGVNFSFTPNSNPIDISSVVYKNTKASHSYK